MPHTDYDIDRFDPNNPYTAIAILGERIKTLVREKESLERALEKEREDRCLNEAAFEKRMAEIEKSFQRGAGVMLVLPLIGGAIGVLIAYGKTIFRPWTGP